MLNIAIMTDYLTWSSKRVSYLIFTHPNIMISIIKQKQASITCEINVNLGEFEENAAEK
jgi:hypothetical protein